MGSRINYISSLTSVNWKNAYADRAGLRTLALNSMGLPVNDSWRKELRDRVSVVSLMAGAGTRWEASIKGRDIPAGYEIGMPRCLFPIDDISNPGQKVPIGVYTLRAARGLGRHVIVWSSHRDLIEKMVQTAGITDARFVEQSKKGFDKPLGHGDATAQALEQLGTDARFVIALFGGDANCQRTIETSLVVLAALQELEERDRPWGLIPTALKGSPDYGITLDDKGFPLSFSHKKLSGTDSSGLMQTNIGVRLYNRADLENVIGHFSRPEFFDAGFGYRIPGNVTNEFALDNVDAYMALDESGQPRRKMRLLNIAGNAETGKVKEFGGIEAFLDGMREISGPGY